MTVRDIATPAPACRTGPLTVAQRQLFALNQIASMPGALNLSYALLIEGPLDAEALAEAFRDLVQTNEPLRTAYRRHGDTVLAEVAPVDAVPAPLTLPARPVTWATAAELALLDRDRGFDLDRDPPIRATLLKVAPRQHVLLLCLHHIASDGWSLYLLRTQLSAAYAARVRGEAPTPAPRRAECIELARAEAAWLHGPDAEADARWWTKRLRGATATLPGLSAARLPGQATAVFRRQVVAVPDPLATGVSALARQAGVSLFVALLTAFMVVIERCLGCAHAVVGTMVANRSTADAAATMGAHYNAVLLDTDLGGDPSLAECLVRVGVRTVDALDRQALPLPVLSGRLRDAFGWNPAGTPSIMFISDRYPMEGLILAGCRVAGLAVDNRGGEPVTQVAAATTADLVFFAREAGNRLTLSALYRPGALGDSAVSELAGAYLEVLAVLRESPELPLSELCIAPDSGMSPGNPPGSGTAPAPEGTGPVLREVTQLAPVDALSPVGVWEPVQHEPGGMP